MPTGLRNTSVTALAIRDTTAFAGTWNFVEGGIYRSTDFGESWKSAGLANTYINAIAFGETILYAGTMEGLFRSTDKGQLWTPIADSLPGRLIHAIAVSDSNIVAAMWHYTIHGAAQEGLGVAVSSDAGATWAAVDSGLCPDVNTLLFVDSNLFAGTNCGIFVSRNKGLTWERADDAISPGHSVISFASRDSILFAGISGISHGVIVSSDHGRSWAAADSGLPDTWVYALAITPDSSRYLLAGTVYHGIWRRPLSEMITIAPMDYYPVATSMFLYQNYPNPFNPTTRIPYQVAKLSHVTIEIFDALGMKVTTLVDGIEAPGYRSITFDGIGYACGVYYYRLRAGGYVTTRKLVLAK